MCGITGIFAPSYDLSVINEMTNSLWRRGPDGSGIIYFDNKNNSSERSLFGPGEETNVLEGSDKKQLALGHTRLSIIDLDVRSAQPLNCANGRYWIVFNGEIFNYIELRKELSDLGYKFNTKSDTEVVLNAYDHWGKDCLHKFNGMWAFCIYDTDTNNLFLSRDRFGEKPLYYSYGSDFFIFGSEIKSLFSSKIITPEVDKSEISRFMKDGPVEFLDTTFFANVFRLPPGHYLELSLNTEKVQVNVQKYYYLTFNSSKERFNKLKAQEYAQKYYDLLKDSVRLRIRADVPIGSALSGGLDSSSIVYLINEINLENNLNIDQKTFSCVYKNSADTKYCDESHYIELLARDLKITNFQITPIADKIPEEHELMIKSFECPPENTCMSGWWTYKLVQQENIKVTLDGQGADEQLTGYLYYYAFFLYSLSLRDFMREIWFCAHVPGAFPYVWRGASAFVLKMLFGPTGASFIIKRLFGRSVPQNLNEVLSKDYTTGLVNLFNNADRGAMAHSVESRMPFVDYRLVEFLASVPSCYKIHKGWSKYLARLAFKGKLPDEICWRRDKMGWPIPEDVWFKGELKLWMKNECVRITDIFNGGVSSEYSTETKKSWLRLLNISVSKKIFNFKVNV